MKIILKIDPYIRSNLIGYFDLTVSIQRRWKGDRHTSYPTWRHVTLGLRSPLLWHWWPFKGFRWYRLRFGYGCGNVYLGVIYIVTTFGNQNQKLEYENFGPFTWAHPVERNWSRIGG